MTHETHAVELRRADVHLILAIISGLAELSGDDCDRMYKVKDTLRSAIGETTAVYSPDMNDTEEGRQSVTVNMSTLVLMTVRHELLSKVRSFTARDIDTVFHARSQLDKVLKDVNSRG